jgi:hypothetical protein
MNDWSREWFILILARERQQRLLREAGVGHALHQARSQNQPAPAQATGFSAWVAHALRFRKHERILER